MNRHSTRLTIIFLIIFLVAGLFTSQPSVIQAQSTDCTSQQLLQADRLLRDAQDALSTGNVDDALQALKDAETILQQCQSGSAPIPTRVPTRPAAGTTGTTKAFVGTKSGIKLSYPNRTGWLAVDLTTRVVVSNNAGAAVSLLNNDRPRSGEMWVFVSVVKGSTTMAKLPAFLETTIKQAFSGKTYTRAKIATARSGTLSRAYVFSDLATEDKRIIMFPMGATSIGLLLVNARTAEMSRFTTDLNLILTTVAK